MMIEELKDKITGPALAKTLRRFKLNKYRLAKLTGLSYRTLSYWEHEGVRPTDEAARKVAAVLMFEVTTGETRKG